jgi:serine protein kinase
MPVERIFIAESTSIAPVRAPHDPTTADIADLVGSVTYQSRRKLARGDPRVWSWSGAVWRQPHLEMINLVVKRELLYLLLTRSPGERRSALPAHSL